LVLHNTKINPFDTLEEATKLLSVIPQELADRLILIGGQALLLWGEYYLIDKLTGKQLESLASDDLDFMGRKPEVEDCANAWHGEARLPDIDDHTPQSKVRVTAAISACYYYLVDICDNQISPRTLPNVVTYMANSILLYERAGV